MNPLLTKSNAPFSATPFDQIQPAHFVPAIEEGIRLAKLNIEVAGITQKPVNIYEIRNTGSQRIHLDIGVFPPDAIDAPKNAIGGNFTGIALDNNRLDTEVVSALLCRDVDEVAARDRDRKFKPLIIVIDDALARECFVHTIPLNRRACRRRPYRSLVEIKL
jgi:hypothetical protein